jgi:diguanylate cyclase (GGDEF)-like protein
MGTQTESIKSAQQQAAPPLQRLWLVRHPGMLVVLLLLLGACIVAATILFAARGQDEVALAEQTEAVHAALSTQQRMLSLPNRDLAWSAELLAFTRYPDQNWAREHLGETLHVAFGVDAVLVLDTHDKVLAAFEEGREVGPAILGHIGGGLNYLTALARTVRNAAVPVTGLLAADGRVAVASATVIRQRARPDLPSGPDAVLIFLQYMDDTLLAPIRHHFDLKDLSVVPMRQNGSGAFVPLIGLDESELGGMTWVAEHPGDDLIDRVLPPIALAFAAMTLLAWLIARQIEAARKANQRNLRVIAAKNAELERAAHLQATTWNAIDEGFIVLDRNLRVVSWNDTFVTMSGISPAVLKVGQPSEAVFRMLDQSGDYLVPPSALAHRLEMLARRSTQPIEYKIKDGRVIEVRQIPLPDGGLLVSGMDITTRRKAEERVAYLARHDALTNLWNRTVFVEHLNDALARMRRGEAGIAVLYLDLDHFKDVNDTLGHPIGDALLKAVARRLIATIRAVDVAARFGGDEFAVLQTHVSDPGSVSTTAERIIHAMAQPFEIDGNSIHIGTSIGVCVPGQGAADPEEIMRQADLALYQAKEERRGTYRFHDSGMNEAVRYRVAIASDLHRALESDELFLEYQPQVDLRSGRLVGLEALARWRHPQRGLIPPAEFIPVAERTGLMPALGSWILKSALRQGRQWLDAGLAPPTIAVNISALQVRGGELEHEVVHLLEATGFPGNLLELEVTESIFFEATRGRRAILERFRQLGIRIAIDDFGTGYSSLEYLRVFPADRLKIAGTFVQNLERDANNAALVTAAVGLGKAFGLTTIAEGVERPAEAGFLRNLGCDQAQGFLYAQPLSVSAVAELLRRSGGAAFDPATGALVESVAAIPARLGDLVSTRPANTDAPLRTRTAAS